MDIVRRAISMFVLCHESVALKGYGFCAYGYIFALREFSVRKMRLAKNAGDTPWNDNELIYWRATLTTKAELEAQMVDFSQMQASVTALLQARHDGLSAVANDMNAAGYPTSDLQAQLQSYSDTITVFSEAAQRQYDALMDIISKITIW